MRPASRDLASRRAPACPSACGSAAATTADVETVEVVEAPVAEVVETPAADVETTPEA